MVQKIFMTLMKNAHRFLNIPDYLPNIDVSKYKTKGMGWLQFHKQLQFEDLGNDKILPWLNSMGYSCLLYTSPSPRDRTRSRMPSSA